MRELEQEKKSLPPLSQSRYGDMARETAIKPGKRIAE
jgi:hypothetical protein